jgi:clan AA aspartic protease
MPARKSSNGVLSPRLYFQFGSAYMGLTHVTVAVRDLAMSAEPYEGEFLVDTGAIDCLAPRDRLLAAGIRPEGRAVYELADGTPVELEYRFARIEFVGQKTVALVIFGPPNAEPILGTVALENVGVVVDPVSKTPKRLHAKPLKRALR